jgi:hypothetical protein
MLVTVEQEKKHLYKTKGNNLTTTGKEQGRAGRGIGRDWNRRESGKRKGDERDAFLEQEVVESVSVWFCLVPSSTCRVVRRRRRR